MSSSFTDFVNDLDTVMRDLDTKLQLDLTKRLRVNRGYSLIECSRFLGVNEQHLRNFLRVNSDIKLGTRVGKTRRLSHLELMKLRVLFCGRIKRRERYLNWRGENDPLVTVSFSAQKGGTGKSLAAAHFAQYLNLNYGLRVGLIDADPQATLSLYFADSTLPLFHPDTPTMADFMGCEQVGITEPIDRSAEEINKYWLKTGWPGIRILAGGASIQNADLSLSYMAPRGYSQIYRVLKDSIEKWSQVHCPWTTSENLLNSDKNIKMNEFESALEETFDVIIIDQQPALTLTQLNGLIAADTCVIPQTLKGFDLSTLSTYIGSIGEYLETVLTFDDSLCSKPGGHIVLPSIVQTSNDRDIKQMINLLSRAPEHVSKIFYGRSDAVANAAENYMSIYEYAPPPAKRKSAESFIFNANAVNDFLTQRALPHLPSRKYAPLFLEKYYAKT